MTDLPLAQDFPTRTRDDWLALVDQTLKGADFDKRLVTRTHDGIAIQPLYTGDDARPSVVPQPVSNDPWRIAQAFREPDPVAANASILTGLEGGVTALVLRIADAPDAPGMQIWTEADMARALEDVRLDAIPVRLEAGGRGIEVAALFLQAAEVQGCVPSDLTGALGIDPIGALARGGALPASFAAYCATAKEIADAGTSMQVMTVSTQPFHLAGCSDAQELGLALASGVATLRGLEAAGMAPDAANDALAFVLTADADVFATIAKLRAWRTVWDRVLQACGVVAAEPACDVETATRMLTRRDPWVNMLRATAATFAAAVGGAETIAVAPFTVPLGVPDSFARRIARNAQIILQEESQIARVADAAHGSWYLESLTAELAEKAWDTFQAIEAKGGMLKALEEGAVQEMIGTVRDARARDIAKRKQAITGTSEFPHVAEKPVETADVTPCPAPQRAASDEWSVLCGLAKTGKAPEFSGIDGETCEPLTPARLAEPFEALRDRSDAHLAAEGARPKVFLAELGTPADFTARATFARNFFEAGGLETSTASGDEDLGPAFTASGARLACICSSDEIYASDAASAAQALKAAGADLVYLAGRPGDGVETSGIDDFIFAGSDVLDMLERTHTALGLNGEG